MPPLRERIQDLAVLIPRLLDTICRELGKRIVGVSADAVNRLAAHTWPGNVRELQQVLKKARMLSTGFEISLGDVDAILSNTPSRAAAATGSPEIVTLADAAAAAERAAIERALAAYPRYADAARALGVDVKTLYDKRRRYGAATT